VRHEQEKPIHLLSIFEISDYLGIKQKTLYAMVESGKIPHYRIGRLIRFRLNEIDAWLDECKMGKAQPYEQPRIKKKKRSPSQRSGNCISSLIAKAIDEEHKKYYVLDHGKSDRIEGFGKEAHNGTV